MMMLVGFLAEKMSTPYQRGCAYVLCCPESVMKQARKEAIS